MPSLKPYSFADIQHFFSPRAGEEKLGQTISYPGNHAWEAALKETEAPYVLLGIPEDIGVRANNGIGGAHTGWTAFLSAFLNIQDNNYLCGKDFFLLGHIDCAALLEQVAHTEHAAEPEHLRKATAAIDLVVTPVIRHIVAAGKIPVVIGGGHNNAYPLLKGLSEARQSPINVINMDAHADFRALEGRHSGNGFHYAYKEGYLKHYAAFGLHEGYNNTDIWNHFNQNEDLCYVTFEDIYLRRKQSFEQGLKQCLEHVCTTAYGIELDLDCITDTLSSALSPVGFSRTEALQYIYTAASHEKAAYLHLPEGVAQRADGMTYPSIGKLLAYLVQAFVKGNKELVKSGT